MATQIDTTTASGDATATPAGRLVVVAPSDASLNVLYFGTPGPKLATAQPPYSAWSTQAIGTPSTHNSQAFTGHAADDNMQMVVTSAGNGPYYITATRAGNAWTVTPVAPTGDLNNAGVSGFGAAMWAGIDPQGRLWFVGIDDILATYTLLGGRMSTGGVWTIDSALDTQALGEQNRQGLAAAIVGGYLVIVYDSGVGGLSYRRLDVSQVAIGAWSAAVAIPGVSGISTASTLSLRAIPGGSTGMLAYTDAGGIKAVSYDAVANTWGAVATLSPAAADRHCTLIPGAAGVVYAVWCQFAAANSYAIVGNIYSGGAWSGSVTTLETAVAAGANAAWPNGAFLATGAKLALIWTTATASPWAIQFDAVAAPVAVITPPDTPVTRLHGVTAVRATSGFTGTTVVRPSTDATATTAPRPPLAGSTIIRGG